MARAIPPGLSLSLQHILPALTSSTRSLVQSLCSPLLDFGGNCSLTTSPGQDNLVRAQGKPEGSQQMRGLRFHTDFTQLP